MKKKRRNLLTIRGRDEDINKNESSGVVNNDDVNIVCTDMVKQSQVDKSENENIGTNLGQDEISIPSTKEIKSETSKTEAHSQDSSTVAIPTPDKQVEFASVISKWKERKQESTREKYFIRCCFSKEYRK